MLQLLILVILSSIICVGLHNAMQYEANLSGTIDEESKSILWWWKYHILDARVMPYRLSKPLGNCLRCMASVYSFIPYWWYVGWDFTFWENWAIYPFFILAVSGVNTIIDKHLE